MSVLSKGLPSHLLFVLKSYFRLFWCFACLQPTLPPRVIYRGVLTTARVCGTEVQIFSNIFILYFNLKRNPTFTKNSCHSENTFWKKWNTKSPPISNHFVPLKNWGLLRSCYDFVVNNLEWITLGLMIGQGILIKFWDHYRLLLLHNQGRH